MSNQTVSDEIHHAMSLMNEALSILFSVQKQMKSGVEMPSPDLPSASQKPIANILSAVPPFQARIVRELAKVEGGTATSDELAVRMGLTPESFKGFVRGSGRNKNFQTATKLLYDRDWKDNRRLYILREEGRAAVEAESSQKKQ